MQSGLAKKVIRFLASLKMAVVTILAIALACTAATFIESYYDIPTARYWVYQTVWFRLLLGGFGLCLFAVMLDRWPWKLKHGPFLIAHIGILTLLFGSWLTDKFGIDGNLRVSEGETTSVVEIDTPLLIVTEGQNVQTIPLKWLPPHVEFKPVSLKERGLPYDLRVSEYISHADPVFDFVPKPPQAQLADRKQPALKIKLVGGPMRITQDFWFWTGDASTRAFQAGPAWFEFVDSTAAVLEPLPDPGPSRGPRLTFRLEKGGVISYRAVSSSKEVKEGRVPLSGLAGKEIDPNWKGVKITLEEFVPDAWVSTTYKPSRAQYGDAAPPSAIRVVAGQGGDQADVWLGIGSRATVHSEGRDIEIAYNRKRLMLPFSVRLDRFSIEYYEGTMNPASYASTVTIFGGEKKASSSASAANPAPASEQPSFTQVISMNQPLDFMGITLYQASYEPGTPRPVTSILSVNQDPGRVWKYLGSLLIVLGSTWLFANRYRRKRAPQEGQS